MDMPKTKTIRYHYGGHFIFSPKRIYVNEKIKEKCDIDIDFITYFDLLDHLKKYCDFKVLEGDKFYYLKPTSAVSDSDGLIEVIDDGGVRNMLASYKRYTWKPIDIYTLSREHDMSTTSENYGFTNNASREISHTFSGENVRLGSDVSI